MPKTSRETAERVQGMGVMVRSADRDEVYGAGDAYVAAPGHVPVAAAGTEVVEFTPTDDFARTMAVVGANVAAARA